MVRAGLGWATPVQPRAAARQAVEAALESLGSGRADAALVAATAAWGEAALRELVDEVSGRLGCDAWAGGSVDGLLVAGRELFAVPAVGVLALTGVEAEAVLCEALRGDESRAGPELAASLVLPPGPDDLLLVFPDSLSLAPEPLLGGLDASLGGGHLAGLGASEPPGGFPLVWAGGRAAAESCAALRLRAAGPPRLAVTTGCRMSCDPATVTRASGNWILSLDGEPALDAYRRALPPPLRDAPPGRAGGLLVAIEPEAREGAPAPVAGAPASGLLVRNVVGFDPVRRGFALPAPLAAGRRLAFVSPDAATARLDLSRALEELRPASAAFGCLLSCRTRGEALFEHAGLEAAYLERALSGRPLLGLAGAFQLARGSAPARTRLHTHAGVIALLDAADDRPERA